MITRDPAIEKHPQSSEDDSLDELDGPAIISVEVSCMAGKFKAPGDGLRGRWKHGTYASEMSTCVENQSMAG